MVQEGRRDAALRRLSRRDARELLDPVEFADQRGKLALAFFVGGEDREALRMARASAREAGDLLPCVRWHSRPAAWTRARLPQAAAPVTAVALFDRPSRP